MPARSGATSWFGEFVEVDEQTNGIGVVPPEVRALGEPFAVFHGRKGLAVVWLLLAPIGLVVFPGAANADYATGDSREGSPAGPIAITMAVLSASAGAYLLYTALAMLRLRLSSSKSAATANGDRSRKGPELRAVVRPHPLTAPGGGKTVSE